MASTKRKSFLWSVSLTLTIVICITIVYIFVSQTVENKKFSPRSVKQNSLQSEKLTDENCIPTCDTKECIMSAKSLLSRIDSNVNPCDNAYSFLCGEFVKKTFPDDFQRSLDPITEKLWIELKNVLDSIQAEPGSPSEKLKIIYDSCMDYSTSELQGVRSFQKFLEDDLGISNWPYLDSDFKFADPRRSKLLGKTKFLDDFGFLSVINPDEANRTDIFDQLLFDSEEPFSVDEAKIRFLTDRLLEYFDLAKEDVEIIATDVVYVTNSIIDVFLPLDDLYMCPGNSTYVNCSNLNDEEWTLLCETMAAHPLNEVTNYGGEKKREAIILNIACKEHVKHILLHMESLPHRPLANYFAITFLWKYLGDINFYFRMTKSKYVTRRRSEEKFQPDLRKHCIEWINKNMKLSLTKEFFRQYLTTPIIEQVSDFHKEFCSDIIKMIELQEWIPSEYKSHIINHVGNITLNIGEIKDMLENNPSLDIIEDYYQMINPTRESFFNNILQYKKIKESFVVKPYYSRVIEALNPIETTSFELGAHTIAESGKIQLQYGMFVPPFYTPNLKREINRLSLAETLGHEIGHNIDLLLEKLILNDTESIPEFKEVKECIDNQFSQFKFDILKKNLNGTQYNHENLADSVAITLIDKILEKYESEEQMQFLLPGLAYSTNQFLYMSSFQFWCFTFNSEKNYQEYDIHAPPKFRLIGPSQNSRSYSRLFQCPEGSYMNPVKKCSLLSNY